MLINNAFFDIDYNTQNAKIILGKMHVPLSKTGVISLNPFSYSSKNYIYEKVEIALPDIIVKTLRAKIRDSFYQIVTDDTKAYIVWKGYADEAQGYNQFRLYALEITSDLKISLKKTDVYTDDCRVEAQWAVVKNGIMYVKMHNYQNSAYKYFINEIDLDSGAKTLIDLPGPVQNIGKYMDKIILTQGYDKAWMYDTVFKKLLLLNGTSASFYNQIKGAKHLLTDGSRFYTAPAYLATINNLSEPVAKTPELVMKITYTLTTELEA